MEPNQPQPQEPQPENTIYTPTRPSIEPATTPPPLTPPTRNRTNSKLIVILLSMLLLVTLGLLAYLLLYPKDDTTEDSSVIQSQATEVEKDITTDAPVVIDETADWKTLTSSAYGFSFKHPSESDWTASVSDDPQSNGQKASGAVKYVPCGLNCGLALTLRVVTAGSSADPGNMYGEKQFQGNDYYTLASKEGITKDGVAGTRWEFSPADNNAATIVYYYFTRDNLAYVFEVNSNGAITNDIDITKFGEKIMESVRFES